MNPAPITTAVDGATSTSDSEPGGVLDRPQGANPVIAGDRRAHRCRAHAEHELVVADDGLCARDRRTGRDGVPGAVDRDDLVVDPDVEPEAVEELLRGLEGQVLLLFDQPADEVGQAAVGERDVTGSFENRDARVSVEAAQASRRRHPSRDTTDDHHTFGTHSGSSGFVPITTTHDSRPFPTLQAEVDPENAVSPVDCFHNQRHGGGVALCLC